MRFLAVLLLCLVAGPGWALETVVKDGDTLQLGNVTYKLDGVDAPEFDQICLDDHADPWTCGIDARDRLANLVGKRAVQCEDIGPDAASRKRRLGLCRVDGEAKSLNQLLVGQGFALALDIDAKGRFAAEQADAKTNQRGLWKGCFAAPRDFRQWKATADLLGGSCRPDKDHEVRAVLFPDEPAMPPGCAIKAKFAVRARVTGAVGVYQLQGCRSYASLTKPNRWFCSEEDAQAAGFRRAYNCPAGPRSR